MRLIDASKKHGHQEAVFEIGKEKIPVLVRLLSEVEYTDAMNVFGSGDNIKAAKMLASMFLDPSNMKPTVTEEELRSDDFKNADTMRLFNLFCDVNNGNKTGN
jgi:hypothetical protein